MKSIQRGIMRRIAAKVTGMLKSRKNCIVRSLPHTIGQRKWQVNRFRGVVLLAALLLGTIPLRAQVAVALSPVARQVFWCVETVNNLAQNVPCAGGTITFFNAGTSVTGPLYTDSSGTILAQNPQPLDATGAPSAGPGLWLVNQAYDVVLKDSFGVQQWKILNVNPYQILNAISSITLIGQTS